MHGKIMVYMDSTGRGTVMNLAKTFFDFNRQIWHDKRSMPSAGMFVEFRSDGQRITGIRPSKFQEFKEGSFITEQDFWKSDNDDELEDLQSSRRSAYITQLFRTTDYDTIEEIPLNFNVAQAIQNYFSGEILSVEALKANLNNEKEIPCILDYLIIKRFLNKAFDTLIFMDNSIDQSQFAALKSIMMHLENSYNDMKDKQKVINVAKIFNEEFLSLQCHYQALVSTIDTRKNRLNALEHQVNTLKLELNLKNNAHHDDAKIQAKQEKIAKCNEEIQYYQTSLKKLENLRENFYQKNFAIFENAFKISREKLFSKIISGLNLCATMMDTKIWHLSLKSSGVKNSYFNRNNMENSFCALSFAEHYLSRLNKSSLNPTDQKLHAYIQKIMQEHRKSFLVVSNDLDLLCKIKIQIFTLSPYFIVKHAPKKVNYQSLMRDNSFDMVYIDEKSVWESAADIILEGKHFDKQGKTKFKLI